MPRCESDDDRDDVVVVVVLVVVVVVVMPLVDVGRVIGNRVLLLLLLLLVLMVLPVRSMTLFEMGNVVVVIFRFVFTLL